MNRIMKTNHFITAAILLFGMTSCSTYYRMTSRIESDGSMYREVYAQGDSAFRAGDKTHNPFLFNIDADWQLTHLDSAIQFNFWGEKENLNTKAFRKFTITNGEYFSIAPKKEYARPLAIPHEELKKSFRWFYTYYTYQATYKELTDKGPVPLNNYLNEEEQKIWLQGENAAYNGLNGIELNEKLDDLERKFGEWYGRSQYEICWEVLRHFVSQQGDTAYIRRLDKWKEPVYKQNLSKEGWEDIDIEKACTLFDKTCMLFDKTYQSNYYSQVYKKNQKAMDAMYEEKTSIAQLFYHAIQFELTMPGSLRSSNAGVIQDNTAIWKIDGLRLLAGNYILTAESRVINYWAFGVTLLVLLIALGVFIRLAHRST